VGFMRDSDSPASAQSTPNHIATPSGGFERNGGTSSAAASVKGVGDKKKKKITVVEEDDKPTVKRQKITYGRKDD
jgi:chromatin modification-related protein EAF6